MNSVLCFIDCVIQSHNWLKYALYILILNLKAFKSGSCNMAFIEPMQFDKPNVMHLK